MPTITMMKSKQKIDGSLKKKVFDMLTKITEDDTTAGLHVEPVQNAVDPRIRTARVDINHRAILFKETVEDDTHYIYVGTWPHDDAYVEAARKRLQVNPINGVLEVLNETPLPSGPPAPPAAPSPEDLPAPPFTNPLLRDGHTADSLYEELGLDRRVSEAALAATSDAELDAAAAEAPAWQQDALLGLRAGMSVSEVKEELRLGEVSPEEQDLPESERLKKSFDKPATKMQFTYVGTDAEVLKDVIENSSFDAWRTFLHPSQQRYVDGHWNGPFRLSGGAGTGKTVVVLHRARALARANPSARVVVTTYTKGLAASLDDQLQLLDPDLPRAERLGEPGVWVTGIDALGAQVVKSASPTELVSAGLAVLDSSDVRLEDRTDGRQQWNDALSVTQHSLDADIANPTFLGEEYEAIVLANSIITKADYLRVSRAGRGTALNRARRLDVWNVVEAFRAICRRQATATYAEVEALAAAVLGSRIGPGVADHVVVDEAQDFNAGHWLLLRAAAPVGPDDLFIAEDSHQRIYGQRIPLSRFGIKIVGRSRRLTLNYRTTAENLHYAVGILSGDAYRDIEDGEESTTVYRSLRSGPVPTVKQGKSFADELDAAAETIARWQGATENATIGILARSKHDASRIVEGLNERGILSRTGTSTAAKNAKDQGTPLVMTMHGAKGMEFSHVILMGVGAKSIPQAAALTSLAEAERQDVLQRERSLLYVAASRARDELVVTYSGDPSEFIAE
ncbi:3'-5' exonuclease [Kocuria rosea]|uniref:3'-5' exonuclease n=1 Tax=Kocuria rosea TaxID=1275 RepID=UPI000F707939|nr:3'-5' exonuclease [Kocuria rosea]VEI51278.1 ATP-dependent DNA helicase pcrA [Kocuria rosea]